MGRGIIHANLQGSPSDLDFQLSALHFVRISQLFLIGPCSGLPCSWKQSKMLELIGHFKCSEI